MRYALFWPQDFSAPMAMHARANERVISMRRFIFLVLSLNLLLTAGATAAHSYNVDFGDVFDQPAATFGAAAGTPGPWNQVTWSYPDTGVMQAIASIDGLDSVTITVAALHAGNGLNGSTDEQKLLDDYFYISTSLPGWRVEIAGLPDGTYDTYIYAPSRDDITTGPMDLNGVPLGSVPGSTDFSLVPGLSHAVATTEVQGGVFDLSGGELGGLNGLAGLQIMPSAVPVPAAAWLFASAIGLFGYLGKRKAR
jgi:hypothetical protein